MQKFYLEAVSKRKHQLDLYQVATEIHEANRKARSQRLAGLSGWRLRVAHGSITKAIKESGRRAGFLDTSKKKRTSLKEEDGVRLGLVFKCLEDMKDTFRAHELVSGVYMMSREEAYYWYAKVFNGSHSRGVRALRVLLAGVKRS